MKTDHKIIDEKIQCNINRGAAKYHHYVQVELINMIMLQVKKYYHLIKVE